MTDDASLLQVDGLSVEYMQRGVRTLAVSDVSLRVDRGRTLGLVGESGSGKSTIGRAILGLLQPSSGSIRFEGEELLEATPARRRRLSSRIQAIFQDPYGSLNPTHDIETILTEPLRALRSERRRQATQRAREMLDLVGLSASALDKYPAEFSGGQRQRIAIARALITSPSFVVCDEIVSALDLSVQAQVLNLLLDLQERLGISYLFIAHNLDVVRYMSTETAVLCHGEVVECGPSGRIADAPEHHYSISLAAASPVPDPRVQRLRRAALSSIQGRNSE